MRLADLALASCCAAAALLAYAPTLHPDYGFTFDDHLAIVNNADVDPARVPAAALLRHDIWGRPLWAAESHKSWRPLLVLSFRWSFASGGMDAAWFRLVGVLAHGVAATPLVYALARQLRLGRSGAFAAALLFAVHPVHVEAVASAVNRAEPLAAACCLAFDLLYCWLAQEKRGAAAWALGAPLLVSFFVAAVGFKETGCCVAGLCLGRELVARLGARRGPLLRPLLRAAFLSCLAALYLSARHAFAARPASPPAYCASWRMAHHAVECDLDASAGFSEGSTLRGSGLLRVTENPVAFTAGLSRVLSVAHLHAVYASLLVWPRVLVAEYAYDCVPVVEAGEANAAGEGRRGDDTTPLQDASTVSQLPAALAEAAAGLPALLLRGGAPAAAVARAALLYLVLLGLAAAGVSAARRRPGSPSGRALLVALGYLGAYFLPASMVFFTVGTHVAERLLYLPSVGLCLLLGLALRGRPSALRLALLFAAAAAAAQRLRRRCEDWRSDAALHRATVRDCPRSAKAHLLLSQQLAREGRAAAALRHAAEARRIHPQYCDVDFAEATALLASDSDAALAAALPAARALLLRSLDCPYSAAAALRSLEALWDADASGAFGPGRRFAALAERAAAFLRGGGSKSAAAAAYREAGAGALAAGLERDAVAYLRRGRELLPWCDFDYWIGAATGRPAPFLRALRDPRCAAAAHAGLAALGAAAAAGEREEVGDALRDAAARAARQRCGAAGASLEHPDLPPEAAEELDVPAPPEGSPRIVLDGVACALAWQLTRKSRVTIGALVDGAIASWWAAAGDGGLGAEERRRCAAKAAGLAAARDAARAG